MKFLILIYWDIRMCVLIKLMVKTLLVHLVVVYSGAYLLACVLMNVLTLLSIIHACTYVQVMSYILS